jgi:alpha-glucosidase
VGRDLLVAAPPRPEAPQPFDICLPAGGWYDYWTGLAVTKHELTQAPQLGVVPVFVRAGAILPRQALVQTTSETPKGPLQLDVYPGDDCRGQLYFDDGLTTGGPSLRQAIECTVTEKGVGLRFGAREGAWRPWWKQIAVTVHGPRTTRMIIPDQAGAATIQIR